MNGTKAVLALALVALTAACGDEEIVLPGERLDVRTPLVAGAPGDAAESEAQPVEIVAAPVSDDGAVAGPKPVPVNLPGMVQNAEWTHRGGASGHRIGHVALGGSLTRVWSAPVGTGDTRKNRIAADPVVGGGAIFTLDAAAAVTATGTNGGTIWRADLTPASDRSGDASGGGLSFGSGSVYATTGFGEIVALDAGTGAVRWRQRLEVPAGGAPTVDGATVYVSSRDGSGLALRAADGKILWRVQGTPDGSGVTGVSAPAAEGARVVFPFPSGQLLAVDPGEGQPVWQGYVAGKRLGRAYASISDLTGDPVLSGGTVFAGSASGRLAAIDLETGQNLWFADEGAAWPVTVAGGAVWLVSDENQLVRLDAATGEVSWRVDMPYFTKDRDKKRNRIFAHYGPVLAGGRLVVVSSDGFVRSFDPASGTFLGAAELPGGAASGPAVAGGTLYVISRKGQLHAFR